jgi:hypothetical protein
MPELTEKEFSKYLHTKFRIRVESRPDEVSSEGFELELKEVQPYASNPGDQEGLERFSLFFTAPPNVRLAQGTFLLEHEQMGELALFIVPVSGHDGVRYEAVFNCYR